MDSLKFILWILLITFEIQQWKVSITCEPGGWPTELFLQGDDL